MGLAQFRDFSYIANPQFWMLSAVVVEEYRVAVTGVHFEAKEVAGPFQRDEVLFFVAINGADRLVVPLDVGPVLALSAEDKEPVVVRKD